MHALTESLVSNVQLGSGTGFGGLAVASVGGGGAEGGGVEGAASVTLSDFPFSSRSVRLDGAFPVRVCVCIAFVCVCACMLCMHVCVYECMHACMHA